MPVIICPTCAAKLEVADSAIGREVECGGCGQKFEAKRDRKSKRRDDDDRPKKRSKYRRDDDDDDDDDFDDRPPRPTGNPSKGAGIASLILGIIALVFSFCPVLSGILAVVSIILGVVSCWTAGKVQGIIGMVLSLMAILSTVGIAVWMMNQQAQFNATNNFGPAGNQPGFNQPGFGPQPPPQPQFRPPPRQPFPGR